MSHVAPENDQQGTPDLGVVITSPKARCAVYGVYIIGALVVGGVGAYFLGIHQPIPEPVIGAQAVVAYLGIPIGGLAFVNRNR